MKNLDTSFASFEISSIALGYRALDVITRVSGVEVLEASPVGGGRFLVFCSGDIGILREASDKLRVALGAVAGEALADFALVERHGKTISEALFSLSQVQLGECLIVVECKSISGLLASAESICSFEGIEIIELKVHRGGTSGGYGFFSGPSKMALPAGEEVRTKLKSALREGHVEVIESPTERFREFFNFSGEA